MNTDQPQPQLDRRQPCRVATNESGMRGQCLRCGSLVGEPCLDQRSDVGDVAMRDGLQTRR
jgi:hypothetical protein